jgi:hypothetical protein
VLRATRPEVKRLYLPLFGHKSVSKLTCNEVCGHAKQFVMFERFAPDPVLPKPTVSWRVWLGTRLLAILCGALVLLAIALTKPVMMGSEPPTIQAIRLTQSQAPRPKLVPQIVPKPLPRDDIKIPKIPNATPAPSAKTTTPLPTQTRPNLPLPPSSSPSASTTPSLQVAPRQETGTVGQSPSIATSPSTSPRVPTSGSANGEMGQTGQVRSGRLRGSTMALLRARECARLEVRERPADCPPNDELMRLLAQEREPKYRPENADAFSRNEQSWRGVPPPCLEDGKNFKLNGAGACVRFGNVPSRVRSPQEICEARGLGGCSPVPNQAAVNAGVAQARALEAAKAKRP